MPAIFETNWLPLYYAYSFRRVNSCVHCLTPQHKMIIKTSVQTTVQLTISLSWMKVLIIMTHTFAIDFHESLSYYELWVGKKSVA